MTRYAALRAHLGAGVSITCKNGSIKKIGFTAAPVPNDVLIALSATESQLGYSTSAVNASMAYRNTQRVLVVGADRVVLGNGAGALALATDSEISSVTEFQPADTETITRKWGWATAGLDTNGPNTGGSFWWPIWNQANAGDWSQNRAIVIEKGVMGRRCLDLKTTHAARAEFIKDVTGVVRPLVDSVWMPSTESPGVMATNPGLHAALSSWARKGLIGVAIPWNAGANGYVIGYYLPGPGVSGIPMVGYAFQEQNGQSSYGLTYCLIHFWRATPTQTYVPKMVPVFNVQVTGAHAIQSAAGGHSFATVSNTAPAPLQAWNRIGCKFTGPEVSVSNPHPAIPGFASVNDWLNARYPIYIGYALGQPIVSSLTVLLGTVSESAAGLEVDESAVVVGTKGVDLRLMAEGSTDVSFTAEQWSEMGAQYYQTLIERVHRRVPADPIALTRTYELALEAEIDIRAEVMVPATTTNPEVTFGQASARAAGKGSRMWHLIRATSDLESYAGGKITLTVVAGVVTASMVIDSVTVTDEDTILDAYAAGAPVNVVNDGSVEDPHYAYFGASQSALSSRMSAAEGVTAEWVESSYRGGALFTPASLDANFPAFGILHMGAADRSSMNGVVAGLVFHGSLVWDL